jgi:RNA polymerase sigma-70 factor (ECF subfamily)
VTAVDTSIAWGDEQLLVHALRERDEHAFAALLRRYNGPLIRFARTFVHDRQLAEDVVQETWLGVLRGLDTFRGESSLKTWIYRIMINTARTRAVKEQRSVPFSAIDDGDELGEAPFEPDRFLADGRWSSTPTSWSSIPEARLLANEARACIQAAIESLPRMQRLVITLRDVSGWTADEVCGLLDLSAANQRVLLHRARSRVRAALESYLDAESS